MRLDPPTSVVLYVCYGKMSSPPPYFLAFLKKKGEESRDKIIFVLVAFAKP